MANSKITIKHDLGAVSAQLLNAYRGLHGNSEKQRLMRNVATLLENSTRRRFETKTDPDGKAWADWKPSTKAQKKYQKRTRERLLNDERDLLRSITHHASATMAKVGTSRQYAPYHQLGTYKMAKRTFLGISRQDKQDILDELDDWLMAIFAKR